tara:strand:- start:71 stop:193 length:123 start_codon:yes stop_codon:yes gene_type:complete
MAITYNEDGTTSNSIAERQEAKKEKPKSNGTRKGTSKKGY